LSQRKHYTASLTVWIAALSLGLLATLSTRAIANDSTESTTQSASDVYGEPLSEAAILRISDLLATPEKYVGETVKVTGLVDDVCPMEGCWIDVLERGSKQTVRFKAKHDVIAFPVQAEGREVVAEGVFGKRALSREQAIAWLRHLAEERGEPFDEAAALAEAGDGMVLYQINARGAELLAEAGPDQAGAACH